MTDTHELPPGVSGPRGGSGRTDSSGCDHDFVFVSEGYYSGSRPGWSYDEFYCRRCLHRCGVRHSDGVRFTHLDPRWHERTKR